jgi:hypothetical protein
VKHSTRQTGTLMALVAASLTVAMAVGCAGVKAPDLGGSGGNGARGGLGGARAGLGGHMTCNGLCADFPTDPVIDPSAPSSAPSMFGGAPSGAGPCVVEPQDNTLYPNNWLAPHISVQGTSGLLQITVHSDLEANDLVVYTSGTSWDWGSNPTTKTAWGLLANHVVDQPIAVTVRGVSGGASTTHFIIASVSATGKMVFWAANPSKLDIDIKVCRATPTECADASELRGFAVGDATTIPVLAINQVQQTTQDDSGNSSPVTCIGCHSGTPDDGFVTFVDSYPWRAVTASVQGTGVPQPSGMSYPTVTPGGLQALLQPGWGPFSFTKTGGSGQFWQTGLKIGVASLGLKDPLTPDNSNGPDQNDSPNLAWINLEAPNAHVHQNSDAGNWTYVSYAAGAGITSNNALGIIPRTGDPYGAAMPNWSHDGTKIVYASTNASISSRLNREVANPAPNTSDPTQNATQQNSNAARVGGLTNLYTVPFNGGLGGAANPVNGAATTAYEEYYPAFSPDDEYIVYTRVPAGQVMYANPSAELAMVPAAGTTSDAISLAANAPPACSGKVSPGVNNHWAKWSPDVEFGPMGKYYWMIFSSNRAGFTGTTSTGRTVQISQLYLAPVIVTETGIETFPAVYLWNQPTDHVNTTPAWDTFDIPVIP